MCHYYTTYLLTQSEGESFSAQNGTSYSRECCTSWLLRVVSWSISWFECLDDQRQYSSALRHIFLVYCFFVPMYTVHQNMLDKRRAYETMLKNRTYEIKEHIQIAIEQGNYHQLQVVKDELEQIQMLHPDKTGYARWPFDRRILITFLSSHIASFVAFIGTIANIMVSLTLLIKK